MMCFIVIRETSTTMELATIPWEIDTFTTYEKKFPVLW
jgi:hypothetical protein